MNIRKLLGRADMGQSPAPPEVRTVPGTYPSPFPDGHFYSPVVNRLDVLQQGPALWPERPEALGIDFNDASHEHVLTDLLPRHMIEYDYPEKPRDESCAGFYTGNTQFGWLDSRVLFAFLRAWRPKHIIEVGSGYSSLLMADVNRRFVSRSISITCVEPYPRDFLTNGVDGISRLLTQKVQETPLTLYEELQAGDILFIDSSHVSKTGSDVNFLYFEVFPRLHQGVRVHIHDIFLPHEYPRDWVLDDRRSWNEQYVLRAMLMHSSRYRVMFGCSYAFYRFPDLVAKALALPGGGAFGGSSFWIEVV